ncbi:MAG: hypothetical protein Q8O67_10160 [Deltaproteobacteria bacterium]|nr:hypothetical protein [Deltaproteobacteria bacterium]
MSDELVADEMALMRREETSVAPQSQGQFVEPWHRRVREVDDDTVAGLLQQLVLLRRLRNLVAVGCCLAGMAVFGFLEVHGLYAALIYGVLALMVGMPVFAVGSLSVRRLFLKEARRQGLSTSAAVLVLTRAERRARTLAPWRGEDKKIDELLKAVRDPDTA